MNSSNFLDSKLMTVINRFVDLVCLSFLWVILSLPIVTIGLSSAALFHTVQKCIVDQEGTLTKTFLRSIKDSWKQALPIGTGFVILMVSMGYIFVLSWLSEDGILTLPFAISFCVFMMTLLVQVFMYPLIGHFYLTFKQLFLAVLMVVANHPLKSVGLTFLLLICIIAAVIYPPLLMIVPARYALIVSKVASPLFFRYIRVPSSDPDSETDLIVSDDTQ